MKQNDQTGATRFSRASTEYGDVVLDEKKGKYWHLNETATLVLTIFQQGGNHESAVSKLVAEYNVDAATAQVDVTVLYDQLQKVGLI
ncbi:lasso peptide biosynthesis PqqD family chaperone [Nocardia transvalensis]|uniref:lasso peptide biosynthesis PqqD family chaperone n=1 Tax=Nocardia transvalensis TaxID=37333 RepID=UPI001893F2B7|nr:lasso peptide biosynthesis PqqD family chaperone [Nocardia transvalensis]MBF6332533.1 lasso peptide biosynthesis PqqD family chaperone [Nocardia transvalensis]